MSNDIDYFRTKMAAVYAANSLSDIASDRQLLLAPFPEIDNWENLIKNDQEKQSVLELIERLKGDLEGALKFCQSSDDQAAACLNLVWEKNLKQKKDKDKVQNTLLHILITKSLFFEAWRDPLKSHFRTVYDWLLKWNTVFLSYTNKGAKAINSRFEAAIRLNIEDDLWNKEHEGSNLLAKAVFNILNDNNVRAVFFDKDEIEPGDPLDPKIEKAAVASFAFLQLIHRNSFDAPPDNWSFKEICWFLKGNDKINQDFSDYQDLWDGRIMFLLCGKDLNEIKPADFPEITFKKWTEEIKEKRYESLNPKDIQVDPFAFSNTIDKLARKVIGLKRDLIWHPQKGGD
jgi:hypothetical protein